MVCLYLFWFRNLVYGMNGILRVCLPINTIKLFFLTWSRIYFWNRGNNHIFSFLRLLMYKMLLTYDSFLKIKAFHIRIFMHYEAYLFPGILNMKKMCILFFSLPPHILPLATKKGHHRIELYQFSLHASHIEAFLFSMYKFRILSFQWVDSFIANCCYCLVTQWCPPSSSVHGISQARILEWVAIPSPGELPNPEIKLASPVSPESPALQVDSLSLSHWGSPVLNMRQCYNVSLKYQLWFIKFIRKIIVYCIQISALSIDPSFLTL